MTRAHIAALADGAVFRPRSRPWELHALHVPFDRLTGEDRYEQRAIARLTQGTCVAVIGASGTGKSSVIAWICDQLPLDHVALRIPITGITDPADVGEVAQLALSTTLQEITLSTRDHDDLQQAQATSDTTRRIPISASAILGGGPIPAGLNVTTASLQQELTHDRLGGEYLLALNSRLVPLLIDAGLTPVFVFEDTEATIGGADTHQRTEGFFAGPLSAFVDQVDAPTLVAVQTHLTDNSPAFARLAPTLERLNIPLVADHAQHVVTSILTRRLTHADTSLAAADVFTATALEILTSFYLDTAGDLRRLLAAADDATDHASLDAAERVDGPHMRFGVGQWETPR